MKKGIVIFLLIVMAVTGYILIVNRNSTNMTIRQKILKAVYPVFLAMSGKKAKSFGKENIQPPVSFYSLKTITNSGTDFDFAQLKGKKVLLVNTASNCGFTNQYDQLQQLHEKYKGKLVILGFPANDFKEQEKGTDEEIAAFCKHNFGVTFPLMKKSSVQRGIEQSNVFNWLSEAAKNGWSNKQPSWNFSKYLVNENGQLVYYFDPAVSPLSNEVIEAIEK